MHPELRDEFLINSKLHIFRDTILSMRQAQVCIGSMIYGWENRRISEALQVKIDQIRLIRFRLAEKLAMEKDMAKNQDFSGDWNEAPTEMRIEIASSAYKRPEEFARKDWEALSKSARKKLEKAMKPTSLLYICRVDDIPYSRRIGVAYVSPS